MCPVRVGVGGWRTWWPVLHQDKHIVPSAFLGGLALQDSDDDSLDAIPYAEALAMACCHDSACSAAANADTPNSKQWRRALWIALVVNAGFLVTEIVAGAAAEAAALPARCQQDSLSCWAS